jgi:hypothetical protein
MVRLLATIGLPLVLITIAGYAVCVLRANAADNIDCCSNLADRVADLEAKANKSNEKVSVTVSGWFTKSWNLWSDTGGQRLNLPQGQVANQPK